MNDLKFNPWRLLKEAREGWDYFVSDEIAYEGKFVNTHGVENSSWVDSYHIGDIWFEVCAYIGNELMAAMLIENCDNTFVIGSQGNLGTDIASCNNPMFVRVRQKV